MSEYLVIEDADEYESVSHCNRYRFACNHVSGKDVLDVACGSGYGTGMIEASGAKKVIGVDKNPIAIRRAMLGYRGEFVVMDAQDLKFPDNSFDVLVSFETLEHTNDYMKSFSEMIRVLRPDGTLIISVPNYAGNAIVKWQARNWKWHNHVFEKSKIRSLVCSNFKSCEMYGQGSLWISFPGRGIIEHALNFSRDTKIHSIENIGREPGTIIMVGKKRDD